MTTSTTQPLTRICPICGDEFAVNRWRPGTYCSPECGREGTAISLGRRGETAAIVPSETKPLRNKPMTDDEFDAYYAQIRRELLDAGRPLVTDSSLAVQEKNARIGAERGRKLV